MTWLLDERRSNRSNDQQMALRYQLEYALERTEMKALVLADKDGLVLAGAGDQELGEEIGAYAPLWENLPNNTKTPESFLHEFVSVDPVYIYGEKMYLISVGGYNKELTLSFSKEGIKRILTMQ